MYQFSYRFPELEQSGSLKALYWANLYALYSLKLLAIFFVMSKICRIQAKSSKPYTETNSLINIQICNLLDEVV